MTAVSTTAPVTNSHAFDSSGFNSPGFNSPGFVQQSFPWMESQADSQGVAAISVLDRSSPERHETSSESAVRNEARSVRGVSSSARGGTRITPRVTVPRVETTTSNRRGRCEHVGGIMGAVLEKYGISFEQLLSEMAKQSTEG